MNSKFCYCFSYNRSDEVVPQNVECDNINENRRIQMLLTDHNYFRFTDNAGEAVEVKPKTISVRYEDILSDQSTENNCGIYLFDNVHDDIAFIDNEVTITTTERNKFVCQDLKNNNEPVYCKCRQVFFGKMILCSNKNCTIKWYHFPCVSLKRGVKGKWYCPDCRAESVGI